MAASSSKPVGRCGGICRPAATFALIVAGVNFLAPMPAPVLGADYVIQISVDGLRPSYLQQVIDAGNAPHFARFQQEGAWTNNARTDLDRTDTLPNHTSMLTGRPVLLPAGMPAMTEHGYTSNGTPSSSRTVHNNTNPYWYKASSFDVVHDFGVSTALYASKSKMILYDQSYNALAGAVHPNGQDKIDTYFQASNSAPQYSLTMHNQFLANTAANPARYTFVHYQDTDAAGHNAGGWGSPNYLNAIVTVNNYLGSMFNLVDSSAALAGRTAIILTADHGGTGSGHGDENNLFNYTIPFYVWGAGVEHGDLYAMNLGTRTDPGTSRPSYMAPGQPIRNGDSGNLALHLLGLGPIPGSLINAAQDLRVAASGGSAPGDFNNDSVVDAADYAVWRKGLGTTYTSADFTIWRSHFGQIGGSGSGSAVGAFNQSVPEPASWLLGGGAVFLWLMFRIASPHKPRQSLRRRHAISQ